MSDDGSTDPYSSTSFQTASQVALFLTKTASVVLTVFTKRRLGTRYLDSWTVMFSLLYIAILGTIFAGGATLASKMEVASMRADESAFVWLTEMKNALQGKLIVPFAVAFLIAVAIHKFDFWVLELRGQYRHSQRPGDPHPPIEAVCRLMLRPIHAIFLMLAKRFKNPEDDLNDIGLNFGKWSKRYISIIAEPILYFIVAFFISIIDQGLGGFLAFSALMLVFFNQLQFTLARKSHYDALDADEEQKHHAVEAQGQMVEEHYQDYLPAHPKLRQRYAQQSAFNRTSAAEALAALDPELLALLSKKPDDSSQAEPPQDTQ